jgi:hypothetical protein
MPYYSMDQWVADGGNPQEFYFGAELPAAAAAIPEVVQAGFTTGQYDNLKAMGLDDSTILSNLNSYLAKTGNTSADVSNWGGEAVKRVMGMQANPRLEAQQQNQIAADTKRMQTNTTDWGYLPMAVGLASGGTLAPWLAGSLGGGMLGSLGANAAVSGLTSAVFGGDPVSAIGRSLVTGGLNAATGGIGNVIKSGGESTPDWMKGFFSGAENINNGTQVAGGTGGAGLGGGMDYSMIPDSIDPSGNGYFNGDGNFTNWTVPEMNWSSPQEITGNSLGSGGGLGAATGGAGLLGAIRAFLGGSGGSGGIGGSLLGAGLGGLLGGMGANSTPSGTVTSISDIPDWQKQYAQYTQQLASGLLNQQSQDPRLTQAGNSEMLKTVQGGYLNSNPYLDATYKQAADQVGAGVDSRFSAAGRYGSGAHQGVLGKSLGDLATNIYGGNYQTERGRQLGAATGVPSYQTAQTSAQFAPLNQYRGLTTGYGGGSQTNPYFSNTAGGILSGALAGSQLGRMF